MDKQGFILHEDVSYIISVKLEELSTAAIIEPTTIQINNLTGPSIIAIYREEPQLQNILCNVMIVGPERQIGIRVK